LDLIQLQSFDLKSYYMHHYQRNMFWTVVNDLNFGFS
jgi:hypothetical protein